MTLQSDFAISIRQPWAELILQGKKNYEFRKWALPDIWEDVEIYLHASKTFGKAEKSIADYYGLSGLVTGAYVGRIRFGKSFLDNTPDNLKGLPYLNVKKCWWWPILDCKRIEPIRVIENNFKSLKHGA